jgi:hypothetical protein
MIAAVKRWQALLSALLFVSPSGANAADSLAGAARELARQTAALAGAGEPVSVAWRNVSSLGSAELAQAREAFEAALQQAGSRIGEVAPLAEAQVTLSENASEFLLVEEARKGTERRVWLAAWKRTGPAAPVSSVVLDKKLVWEQDEPILDAAFPEGGMLVLSASRVTLYTRPSGRWEPREAVPLAPARPFPRDLRGRLRVSGPSFRVYLPGMSCDGAWQPALALDCRAGDEPWVLESGSRFLLLGNFASDRNYFDGRVTAQTGQRKTVAPFFSAAAVEDQGRPVWLLTLVDGRTRLFDAALDPLGSLADWGSDIVGTDARCGGGSQVLATRPGDGAEPDAVRAFAIANRAAVALSPAVDFAGPVTALWPSGGSAALAVVRNPETGKYQAYVVSVVCGS